MTGSVVEGGTFTSPGVFSTPGTSDNWSYTSTSTMKNGLYSLSLSSTDKAGNASATDVPFTVAVPPVIQSLVMGPVVGGSGAPVGDGGSTNLHKILLLSGTTNATLGSTLNILLGTTNIGSTNVTSDTWSSSIINQNLQPGTYSFTVNDGLFSVPFTITIGNDVPIAQVDAYAVQEDGLPITLTPLSNDTDVNGDPLAVTSINGTTLTPGIAQVIPVVSGLTQQGTLNVDTAGIITFTPVLNFAGVLSFPYVADDGFSGTANASININVTPNPPIFSLLNDTGSSNADKITNDPTISGSNAATGATIIIKEGSTIIGSTVVDNAGNWSFTPPTTGTNALTEGAHTLTATATSATGGLISAPAVLPITLDTVAPVLTPVAPPQYFNASTIGSAEIPGTVQDATSGVEKVQYSSNAGATYQNVSSFSSLGVLNTTTQNWSHSLSSLADGAYTYQFQATDYAGNSATSAALNFTIDRIAPTITSIIVNNGSDVDLGSTVPISLTFSEPLNNLDGSQFVISGGTLSNLVVDPGNPLLYTGTLTTSPTTHVIDISIPGSAYQDLAANPGTNAHQTFTLLTSADSLNQFGHNTTHTSRKTIPVNIAAGNMVNATISTGGGASGGAGQFVSSSFYQTLSSMQQNQTLLSSALNIRSLDLHQPNFSVLPQGTPINKAKSAPSKMSSSEMLQTLSSKSGFYQDPNHNYTAWIMPYFEYYNSKTDGSNLGYKSEATGFTMGAHKKFGANTIGGLLTGYGHDKTKLRLKKGKGDVDNFRLGFYAHMIKKLTLKASVVGGRDFYKFNRYHPTYKTTSKHKGWDVASLIKGFYTFQLNKQHTLQPELGMSYQRSVENPYQEQGGGLFNQKYSKRTSQFLRFDGSVKWIYTTESKMLGGCLISPFVKVGVLHEKPIAVEKTNVEFPALSNIGTLGVSSTNKAFTLGTVNVGAHFVLSPSHTITTSLNVQASDSQQSYELMAKWAVRF